MAKKRQTKQQAQLATAVAAGAISPVAEPPTQSESAEVVYPVEVFLDNCKAMFGVDRYVITGALHGRGDVEAGYTKSQMRDLLAMFSNTRLD